MEAHQGDTNELPDAVRVANVDVTWLPAKRIEAKEVRKRLHQVSVRLSHRLHLEPCSRLVLDGRDELLLQAQELLTLTRNGEGLAEACLSCLR